jgi:hypothetical protein
LSSFSEHKIKDTLEVGSPWFIFNLSNSAKNKAEKGPWPLPISARHIDQRLACQWTFDVKDRCYPMFSLRRKPPADEGWKSTFRFLTAYSWEHSAQVLRECPTMLRDESAIALFAYKVGKGQAEGDDESAEILNDNLEFLIKCRRMGIDEALAAQVARFGRIKLLQEAQSDRVLEVLLQFADIVSRIKAEPSHDRVLDE